MIDLYTNSIVEIIGNGCQLFELASSIERG